MERWDSILAAVRSIQQQSMPPDEIVVSVDHNEALADRLEQALPGVLVARHDNGPRGASSNRNAGVAVVTADVVAFLDDDEVADPNWLYQLTIPFTDEQVIGTGGLARPLWEGEEPAWFPLSFGWAIGASYEGMPTTPAVVRNVWGGNMAMRVAVFRQVGGFREDFGKVGHFSEPEDTDLCVRATSATGGIWLYLPDAVISHRVPPQRTSFAFFLRRCYNEGAGKVAMAADSRDRLDPERDYIRKVVPGAVLNETRMASIAMRRIGAMALGVAAAGAGVAGAHAKRVLGRVPAERRSELA